MGEKTKIQWTEMSWNPWHGCHKVSAGCARCYMFRDKERYGQDPNTVVRSKSTFNAPLKWTEPALVFTCSWSDWFIEEADEWRDEAWSIIKRTPHLTYQILTKRPENIADRLPADWGDGYENVWLGVSVENQKAAEKRIPMLLRTPAKIRFLSVEPLLEHVILDRLDFSENQRFGWRNVLMRTWGKGSDDDGFLGPIHWIIVGGESGNENGKYKYRPCSLNWIEDLVAACQLYRCPVFVKQLGTYLSKGMGLKDSHGGDMSEWPEHLRVREMPR